MNFDNLMKLLNLPPILMASLCLSSLLILTRIDDYIDFIEFSGIRRDHYDYLSLAFIVTTIYMFIFCIVKLSPTFASLVESLNKKRIDKEKIKSYIKDLSEPEIQVLGLFIYGDCENIVMNRTQPPVESLIRKNILNEKNTVGAFLSLTSYLAINSAAIKYLKDNKTLFPDRSTEEVEEVKKAVKQINCYHNEIHN